jgi:putative cell wall-binding protein
MSSAKLGRMTVALVAAGAMVVAPACAWAADGGKAAGVERIAGADRYEAAANVSAASFAPGVPVAYVASGAVFTDALSGAPVAAKTGGPMLLVRDDEVPSAVKSELARLKPKKIVVLGGPNSVDYTVEAVLGAYTSGGVERWMGADRYEASAQISQESFAPGVPVAYVASGLNFPDALSGAPVAGMGNAPMLLTDDDRLPTPIAEELDRLKPKKIVVLGGPASVSDEVAARLSGYTTGWVNRYFGDDRYDASADIAEQSFAPGVSVAYVAYGQVFSDALAGAPVAGIRRGPMLLVDDTKIPSAIADALEHLQPKKIVVLGGTNSVNSSVEEQLGAYVSP